MYVTPKRKTKYSLVCHLLTWDVMFGVFGVAGNDLVNVGLK